MTKIYISSTYEDLIEYRGAVAQTILKMKQTVVAMEYYTASDERPLDKCLADVGTCDIYLGIFAFRYGYVPRGKNARKLSITELEYEEAKKRDKRCLIFLADERRWPMIKSDYYTGDGKRGDRIDNLRNRLSERHQCTMFESPDGLAAAVSAALANRIRSRQPSLQRKKKLREAAIAIADYFEEWSPIPRIVPFEYIQYHVNDWTDGFLEAVGKQHPKSFRLTYTQGGSRAFAYKRKRPERTRI